MEPRTEKNERGELGRSSLSHGLYGLIFDPPPLRRSSTGACHPSSRLHSPVHRVMGNAPSSGNAHTARFLAGCPKIPPTPAEQDVLVQFDELLRTKEIAAFAAEELRQMEPLDTKWMYVVLSKLGAQSVDKDWMDPSECVQQVVNVQEHNECVQELFRAIRINMILRPSEWVEKFIAANGVGALVALLSNTKPAYPVVYDELLCVGDQQSSSQAVQRRILNLLNLLLCQQGTDGTSTLFYENVQAARGRSSSPATAGAEHSFRSISHLFIDNPNNPELQMSVLKFLNSLIASTLKVAHRGAIREDLAHHGLIAVLESVSRTQDSEPEDQSTALSSALRAQIHTFLASRESDLRAKDEEGVVTTPETSGDTDKSMCSVSITDSSSTHTSTSEVSDQQDDASSSCQNNVHLADSASPEAQDLAEATVVERSNESSSNQLEEAPCSEVSPTEKKCEPSTSVTTESMTANASLKQLNDQPQESTLLQSLVNQIELQQLDANTNEKIARVLQTLVLSLSTENIR